MTQYNPILYSKETTLEKSSLFRLVFKMNVEKSFKIFNLIIVHKEIRGSKKTFMLLILVLQD